MRNRRSPRTEQPLRTQARMPRLTHALRGIAEQVREDHTEHAGEVGGTTIGAMVFHAAGRHFDGDDRALAEDIAARVAAKVIRIFDPNPAAEVGRVPA
jgi:hypothetical protein